jgi:DNA-binding HxlR family transcriptional regulator
VSRFSFPLLFLIVFASFNTALLAYSLAVPPVPPGQGFGPPTTLAQIAFYWLETSSRILAPLGWALVVGTWAWKGRVRSRWSGSGLDYEDFRLVARMKGGGTRMRLLKSLEAPKDRSQLAKELGLDWKTIDSHVRRLLEYGMVRERLAYGNVRIYELTVMGQSVLHLMNESDEPESRNPERPRFAESAKHEAD